MKEMINKPRAYLTALLVTAVIFLTACNRSIVPKMLTGRAGQDYDIAASDYLFVEAVKQKLMGNAGEALKILEQMLKINQLNDAVYYQMAQIVLNNGDLGNGLKYIKKALEIDPGNSWYLMMIAGVYYQQGNIDSTTIYYEKLVDRYPERENLLMALGNLYAENKQFDRAGEIFGKIDKKYGVNEISTIAHIRSLMMDRKFIEARARVNELIQQDPEEILYRGILAEIYRNEGRIDDATEVYRELMLEKPDDPQTQLSLCEFMIEQKDYKELLTLINTVILNENIAREDKISLMAQLIEIPEIIKEHRAEIELAIMVMEANYLNDDIILLLRPELYDRQNRLDDAAARLEEIIKMRPDNYFAWERLLLIYYRSKRYMDLMIKGEQGATRFNRSFIAKLLYAAAANENQKYETALDELRKAEILAGDNKDLLIQVMTLRGDVFYRMKDFEKSFETFEKALEIDNEDLTIINNYAYFLTERNLRLREAEKMAKYVIERDNTNTAFLDTYAWVLYKRGKVRRAEKIMMEIVNSGEEDDAEWFEHYGYILRKRRKCAEAIIKWEYALKLDNTKEHLVKEIQSCVK
ncbi:MAG: tetratricopeptide repeat protein [Bacteroidales bacterium]|nr:tetratricopeptide repeat protein [Bacteroidales bacterium]